VGDSSLTTSRGGFRSPSPPTTGSFRTLAVLLRTKTGIDDILVAIVQPNHGPPTMAGFDKQTLILAEQTIGVVVRDAMTPGIHRSPSPKACRTAMELTYVVKRTHYL